MCRFLIIKSSDKINPQTFLKDFAQVCFISRAPDGEMQKDGFGVAWKDNGEWQTKKSLLPIWEEQHLFEEVPETNFLVAHARGAGFEKDRGSLDFNEPFIEESLCFVFNGMIRGVRLKKKVPGKIGSQKVLSLLKEEMILKSPNQALKSVQKLILENSREVEGMNVGVIDGDKISVLCQYSENEKYYTLHFYEDENLTIICSEKFGDYNWQSLEKGQIKTF